MGLLAWQSPIAPRLQPGWGHHPACLRRL